MHRSSLAQKIGLFSSSELQCKRLFTFERLCAGKKLHAPKTSSSGLYGYDPTQLCKLLTGKNKSISDFSLRFRRHELFLTPFLAAKRKSQVKKSRAVSFFLKRPPKELVFQEVFLFLTKHPARGTVGFSEPVLKLQSAFWLAVHFYSSYCTWQISIRLLYQFGVLASCVPTQVSKRKTKCRHVFYGNDPFFSRSG